MSKIGKEQNEHLRRSRVTGFPSPADDHLENRLDLNQLLVEHPAATFFMRVSEGDDALELKADDILVLDRSCEPVRGCLVVEVSGGDLCVDRYSASGESDAVSEIWGVVTAVIRKF